MHYLRLIVIPISEFDAIDILDYRALQGKVETEVVEEHKFPNHALCILKQKVRNDIVLIKQVLMGMHNLKIGYLESHFRMITMSFYRVC